MVDNDCYQIVNETLQHSTVTYLLSSWRPFTRLLSSNNTQQKEQLLVNFTYHSTRWSVARMATTYYLPSPEGYILSVSQTRIIIGV